MSDEKIMIYDFTEHKLLKMIDNAANPMIQQVYMEAYEDYINGKVIVSWVAGNPVFEIK
jgi:hypothetical protein